MLLELFISLIIELLDHKPAANDNKKVGLINVDIDINIDKD